MFGMYKDLGLNIKKGKEREEGKQTGKKDRQT